MGSHFLSYRSRKGSPGGGWIRGSGFGDLGYFESNYGPEESPAYHDLLSFETLAADQGRCFKAAFLQGNSSEVERKVYCWPVPELAQALDQSPLTPVQLAKVANGLVNAPSEWHKTVTREMATAGLRWLRNLVCGSWLGRILRLRMRR